MINLYRYIYYIIYKWNLKKFGKNDLPKYNALLGYSLLQFINLMTIIILIKLFFGYDLLVAFKIIYIIFSFIILMIINYFNLLFDKKLNRIRAKFAKENVNKVKKIVLSYIIITIIAFYLSWYLSII